MKQSIKHTANLRATFLGSNSDLPIDLLLQALGGSCATGVLLARTGGAMIEFRLAGGRIVSPSDAEALAALIGDAAADWSFRATLGAPAQLVAPRDVDEVLLAAAFSAVA